MYTVDQANKYIKENLHLVNKKYRPRYHAAPPIGWMNDPNGLILYKDTYHVFYQFYPYGSYWGPMHWGHLTSNDLITFKNAPVALAPDKINHGCFSGSALMNAKGELVLMYTDHIETSPIIERQQLAVSQDGITFTKKSGYFLTEQDLPPGSSTSDFRDPRPILIGDTYYILVGSKTKENQGQLLVYTSKDLKAFTYHDTIGPYEQFGNMAECPDLFSLNGVDVLIVSGIGIPPRGKEFLKTHSSVALIGKFDLVNKVYEIYDYHEIDLGPDFYAPQTLTNKRGETVMIAWLNMWEKDYFTAENGHNWVGQLTIPRRLSVKNNRLYQQPIEEFSSYHKREDILKSKMNISKWSRLNFRFDNKEGHLKFSNPNDKCDTFSITLVDGFISLHLSATKNYPQNNIVANLPYDGGEIEVFLDSSSIEVFIDEGKETLTSTVYIGANTLSLKSEGATGIVYTLF